MDAQIKKGLIELCVLRVLNSNDSYGYQIIKELEDYILVSESTVYPLLSRLEILEYVTVYKKEYNNRLRKYFHITEKGKKHLLLFKEEKIHINKILDFIENGGEVKNEKNN